MVFTGEGHSVHIAFEFADVKIECIGGVDRPEMRYFLMNSRIRDIGPMDIFLRHFTDIGAQIPHIDAGALAHVGVHSRPETLGAVHFPNIKLACGHTELFHGFDGPLDKKRVGDNAMTVFEGETFVIPHGCGEVRFYRYHVRERDSAFVRRHHDRSGEPQPYLFRGCMVRQPIDIGLHDKNGLGVLIDKRMNAETARRGLGT